MIRYELIRQDRKTISILVKPGHVTVKAPICVKQEKIDAFVCEKETWICKKLSAYENKSARFSSVLTYENFLYRGQILKPVFHVGASFAPVDETLLVPMKYGGAFLQPLKTWYKKSAKEYLTARLNAFSEALKLPYRSFALTNAKSKWGSCGADASIRLNWRLLLLPDTLIDYVVVHELCHTKHMNHSKHFWSFLQNCLPDYASRRKSLKEYSLINGMFR